MMASACRQNGTTQLCMNAINHYHETVCASLLPLLTSQALQSHTQAVSKWSGYEASSLISLKVAVCSIHTQLQF